jgi:hypothetical protein
VFGPAECAHYHATYQTDTTSNYCANDLTYSLSDSLAGFDQSTGSPSYEHAGE